MTALFAFCSSLFARTDTGRSGCHAHSPHKTAHVSPEMKCSLSSRMLAVLALAILAMSHSARGQVLYENGPANGHTDAWLISLDGYAVSDSFVVTAPASVTGFSFALWMYPGDTLASVELSITSQAFGGTTFFQGMIGNFTESNCFANQFGFDVCQETASFNGPALQNGSYWVNVQNAMAQNGDVAWWDENSGIGCQSPGCPSTAKDLDLPGTIPSESFTVMGTTSGTGTTPEPSSLLLFTCGALGIAGLRRKAV